MSVDLELGDTWERLETCLYPPPEVIRLEADGTFTSHSLSTLQKVSYCAKNALQFAVLLAVSPLTLSYDWWTHRSLAPIARGSSDLAPTPVWPPKQRGYAMSFFQSSGLGTRWSATPGLQGKCDWDKWMQEPRHLQHPMGEKCQNYFTPAGFDYRNFFTDILSDPDTYIRMLQTQGVTAHRFSLEWSVLQPMPGEDFDPEAVRLYSRFIDKLIEANITPSVTLSHFVMPEWFYASGNFQKMENADVYVQYALQAMRTFPKVHDWWSFNELNIKAFQQTREVYPTDVPEGSSLPKRVYAAGISTRNMLIAHCKLIMQAKKEFPENGIGVTHQWLRFATAEGNWLENLVAHIFTKFGFSPVYNFFKEGKFLFQFPFMANIQFEVASSQWEKHRHFVERIGVQAYPEPMLKMGLNHGRAYPGAPWAITNLPFFSFGSTCKPGGAVMRFGPGWNAEAMDRILDDAFALTDQVCITEFGSDAAVCFKGSEFHVDEEAQKNYLEQLVNRVRDYCHRTSRSVQSLFNWSDLDEQLEWENGLQCKLGTIQRVVDAARRLVGWKTSPASDYMRGVFQSVPITSAATREI